MSQQATEELPRYPAPSLSWRRRLELSAQRLEARPWLILTVLTLLYIAAIQLPGHLILWHDELFTYYIAKATSLQQFITFIQKMDLNPPLGYIFTGIAQRLFGDSPFVTRLPEMIAFFLASLGFMYFLARRIGLLWGMFVVLLLWYSPAFYYATQARPYALVLFFFAITLVSWDSAITATGNRKLALAGIALGNIGMMLSHVFAIFTIGPFLLAEMVRWYRTRKADLPVWACLLLPLSLVASYIPLMNRFQSETFPAQFQGGPRKIVSFYSKWIFLSICPGLLASLLAALATTSEMRKAERPKSVFSSAHVALFAGFLLPPILINLMLMRTHGAFWERYCISTAVAVYVGTVFFVAYKLGANRFTALVASMVLIVITIGSNIVTPYLETQANKRFLRPIDFASFHPDLPFVAANGLTFMEMDHNENAAFVKRLYYLTNRAAALKYAHATLFEGIATNKKYFPVRANVELYDTFLREHHHFLVIGTMIYAEDWLLRKLQDDGAQLTYLGEYLTPYKDTAIYEVTLGEAKP